MTQRDYKREAQTESRARQEARRKRMRARYAMEKSGKVSRNDGKTIEHSKKLSQGGTNAKSNLSVRSKSANSADNTGSGGRPKKGAPSRIKSHGGSHK